MSDYELISAIAIIGVIVIPALLLFGRWDK
jgi:hypothetical protein